MALRSKNFYFLRKSKDGKVLEFNDSDSWFITNPDYKWNEHTEKLAVGGYYGSTTGTHTIALVLRNFIGRIYIQGTLSSNPEDDEWFNIPIDGKEYQEYNDSDIYDPNRDTLIRLMGTTGTYSHNIFGNFTYMRIVIDRDYISLNPTDDQKRVAGKLEEILINF